MNMLHLSVSRFRRLSLLAAIVTLLGSCATSNHAVSRGSLHQVGLVWLKQPGNQSERQKIIDAVHVFGRDIPEVKKAVAGQTDGIGGPFSDTSYDVCFILTFEDEAARQRYNVHPVHEKAAREVFLPLSEKLLFYRFASE